LDQTPSWAQRPVAVLASGGIDSAVLVAEIARTSPDVIPIYIRFGLVWETVELNGLERFLASLSSPVVRPLVVFEMPIQPVYGVHWSTTGRDTPAYDTPDEAVFLPGRNLLLLAQPAIWCHLNGIATIALAPLAANPFPDSTDQFFDDYETVINECVEGSMKIVRPYSRLRKIDVIRRGAAFPIHETFSCIHPVGDAHCGACNKCAERQKGFADAGVADRTRYAT